MKPVMQRTEGANGDCFSACLASLFELPIEEVPNFFETGGQDDESWWAAVRDWLRPRGYGILWLELRDITYIAPFDGWFIVSGKSTRGLDHATIWRYGKMVHDPHPSGLGLVKPESVDLLYPIDPARMP